MADEQDNPYQTPHVQEEPAPTAKTYERPEIDVAEDDDEPPDGKLVAIASMLSLPDAEVLRASLKGSGVRSYVRGHHANQVLGAAAGVKVLVPEPELERAREIMAERKSNEGRPVFVVVGRPFGGYALLGVIGGGIAGMTFYGKTGSWFIPAILMLIGAGLGLWRASAADPFCSAPECGKAIPSDAKTCSGCGGTVAGTIRHPNERLAAEERLGGGE